MVEASKEEVDTGRGSGIALDLVSGCGPGGMLFLWFVYVVAAVAAAAAAAAAATVAAS